MIQEYLCPWGGTSKFNYNQPFYDLVAEMTKACISHLMKVKGISNQEIMDAAIGEVTINFHKELKLWLPFYDINNFVFLVCRKYLNRELNKNNSFMSHIQFNDASLEDIPSKKISYKTVSRFEKVDAAKIGAYAYYLGEGCK